MTENVLDHARELIAKSEAAAGPFQYDDGVLWAGEEPDLERAGLEWLSCCNMDDDTMQLIVTARNHGPEVAAALLVAEATIERLRAVAREAKELHCGSATVGSHDFLEAAIDGLQPGDLDP